MEKITFEPWSWDAEAARGLSIAVGKDGDIIRNEIQQKWAQLWRVNQGESWLVTRAERPELVIVCLQGKNAPGIINHIRRRATEQGFKTIRAHTNRKGLERMFKRAGVRVREIVLEMEL